MKTKLILVTLLLAQGIFAAPMFCRGGEWSVSVSSNKKQATLEKNQQPVQFGELACDFIEEEGNHNVLHCETAQPVADAGFEVLVELGLPGIDMNGSLSRITMHGSVKVTDLKCVGAAN